MKVIFTDNKNREEEIIDAYCYIISNKRVGHIFQESGRDYDLVEEEIGFSSKQDKILKVRQQLESAKIDGSKFVLQKLTHKRLTQIRKVKLFLSAVLLCFCIVWALATTDFLQRQLFISLTIISALVIIRQLSINNLNEIQGA